MRYKRPAREHYHHWRGVYKRCLRALRLMVVTPMHAQWPSREPISATPMSIARPLLNRAYGRMGRLYSKAKRAKHA